MQHIIDNERIQAYRELAFSRGETSSLPSYDEQKYAAHAHAEIRSMESLLDEFQIVRQASIALFGNFTEEQFHKNGVCSEIKVTPLALGFQIVGHGIHHMNVLRERYFRKFG